MAQSSNPRLKIGVTAPRQTKLENAVALLDDYLAPIAALWPDLTKVQRRQIKAAQPVIKQFLQIARQFKGSEDN